MRIILFLIVFMTVFLTGCGDDTSVTIHPPLSSLDEKTGNSATPASLTAIQWIDSARNFGNINEGQKLAISFRFKNTGNKPLVIESVKPTCGCTVADYPKEPIAPGEEAEITGEFDSNGREGLQRKHLTVKSNTSPAEQDITFEVNVVAKARNQNNPSN